MAEELSLALLVDELRLLSSETEWVEFKRNNDGAETIAQDISALANSAARFDAPHAYLAEGGMDAAPGAYNPTVTDSRRLGCMDGSRLSNVGFAIHAA